MHITIHQFDDLSIQIQDLINTLKKLKKNTIFKRSKPEFIKVMFYH